MKVTPIIKSYFINKNILENRNAKKLAVPVVSAPLVAYIPGDSKDKTLQQIKEFLSRKNITYPEHLHPNPSTNSGLNEESKTKLRRKLDELYDKGRINKEEHDRYTRKIAFTGKEPEVPGDAEVNSIAETDMKLPDELQSVLDSPEIETPEGVIKSVLSEEFLNNHELDTDWGVMPAIKSIGEEIMDVGDWL